jgi:two-component system C4-dicarboxylate transport sensor histidine kinase DctB
LRDSNERLRIESNERQQADLRLREAREELAQANRLGIIGQITAGVAHEVNQPVAAIQTCAENASRLMARSQIDRAQHNLDRITALTERIGRITSELRRFARRGTPRLGVVSLAGALDGALLLLDDRLRGAGVMVDRPSPPADLAVIADGVRLEQVLINLIQNAIDALVDTPEPRILIELETADDVVLVVADNGPGVAAEWADTLFTPFVTGKSEGLGLGLGIARDIAREFGGDIALVASSLGGAAFEVRLKRAHV